MNEVSLSEPPGEPDANEARTIDGLALKTLREWAGWTQDRLAAAVDTNPGSIVRWEKRVPREKLLFCTAAMGYEPAQVDALLYGLRKALLRTPLVPWSPVGPTPEERQRIRRFVAHLLYLAIDKLEDVLVRRLLARRARRDRRDAATFWKESLLPTKPDDRQFLAEAAPWCRTWALAELLAHESGRAAAEDAGAALKLAQLSLRVAELASANDPEPWRCRLLGYTWLFVANAYRVGPAFNEAEMASAKGWALWKQGSDPAGLLAEWRLRDLTGSLRRDQRRFEEAHKLHDEARALAPTAETGRILLGKAHTFEKQTAYECALATLDEAGPLIHEQGDARLRFALFYNRTVVLVHLGRPGEACESLAEARGMAYQLSRLDRVRVRWLEGRLAQALGDLAEAQAALEQARSELAHLALPYDFALASLDLALLRLAQGRWGELRSLAAEMHKIFEQHNIHRESMAAVLLFQKAVSKEAATVDLVGRLRGFLETAGKQPELHFEP